MAVVGVVKELAGHGEAFVTGFDGVLVDAVQDHHRAGVVDGEVRLGGQHEPERLVRCGHVDTYRLARLKCDLAEVHRFAIHGYGPKHVRVEIIPEASGRLETFDFPGIDVDLGEACAALDLHPGGGAGLDLRATHLDHRCAGQVVKTQYLPLRFVHSDSLNTCPTGGFGWLLPGRGDGEEQQGTHCYDFVVLTDVHFLFPEVVCAWSEVRSFQFRIANYGLRIYRNLVMGNPKPAIGNPQFQIDRLGRWGPSVRNFLVHRTIDRSR